MRTRTRLLFSALSAIVVLGIGVSAASATHLQLLGSEKGIRIVWARLILEGAGNIIECPVTLEGTFSTSTITKRAGTAIGSITRAAVASASCTGGSARVLTETLPWDIQYSSFAGTLPAITTITVRLLRAAFAIHPTGSLTCLAQTEASHPAVGIINLGAGTGTLRKITSLEAERTAGIPLRGEGGLCTFGGEGHFSGNGSVTVLGETASIEVALI